MEQDRPRLITLRHNVWEEGRVGAEYVAVEEPDGKAITHTSLSADDKVFALASEVPVVRVFDRGTNRELHKITLKEGQPLTALKLSDDGSPSSARRGSPRCSTRRTARNCASWRGTTGR